MDREEAFTSRLDNFVDGAFAFAVTLLVINGSNVPRDIPSLLHSLGGVPAFAVCFAQLAWFWHGHVQWRTSVQLADRPSLLLSLLLVFFALIFVYPLHMVYASFFYLISGGHLPMDMASSTTNPADVTALFVVFGLAFACMAGTLAALFAHGVRRAPHLSVDERIVAQIRSTSWVCTAAVGLISASLALLIPDGPWTTLAGFSYMLLGLMGPILSARRRRLRKALSG